MTTPVYVFIATKTTYDAVLPSLTGNQASFNRKVKGAIAGIAGGKITVGDLKLRSTQDALVNHLLCDGSVLAMDSFPELSAYLGNTFGGDGLTTFALPNYGNDFLAVPVLTATQTITDSSTVSTGGTVTQPIGSGQTGGTTGGNVSSGGRPRREYEQES